MSHVVADIKKLPSIALLIHTSRALALLDAILMPDWEFRYFSFNSFWNESDNEMMASMRNGEGGEYFLLFSPSGVVGKVFDQSGVLESSSVLKGIPSCFDSFVTESAFNLSNLSYCFWRKASDEYWSVSPSLTKELSFLKFFEGGRAYYYQWAQRYYDQRIDFGALTQVFDTLAVTEDLIAMLNPNLTIEDLSEDMKEIHGIA